MDCIIVRMGQDRKGSYPYAVNVSYFDLLELDFRAAAPTYWVPPDSFFRGIVRTPSVMHTAGRVTQVDIYGTRSLPAGQVAAKQICLASVQHLLCITFKLTRCGVKEAPQSALFRSCDQQYT